MDNNLDLPVGDSAPDEDVSPFDSDLFGSDDVELEFNDDGETVFSGGRSQDSGDGSNNLDTDVGDAGSDGSQVSQGSGSGFVPIDQYKELQADYTRKAQALARLEGEVSVLRDHITGRTQDSADDPKRERLNNLATRLSEIFGNDEAGQGVASIINEYVSDMTKESLRDSGVDEVLGEAALTRELRSAQDAHPDFVERLPQMREVFNMFPNSGITFEQAYQLAVFKYGDTLPAQEGQQQGSEQQTAQAGDSDIPNNPAATPTPAPKDRQELAERASRLHTETSSSNDSGFKPGGHASTIREAFNAALEEVYGA